MKRCEIFLSIFFSGLIFSNRKCDEFAQKLKTQATITLETMF